MAWIQTMGGTLDVRHESIDEIGPDAVKMYTFGHGTLPREDFVSLIQGATIDEIVDVRSFPGSRHNPQFGRSEMERWLPEAGIVYSWMQDLGGRRKPQPGSRHVALRHPSFRAYADYMDTDPFIEAIDELLTSTNMRAIMCSESVWWRCHRRLIADYLTLVRQVEVLHLMHGGQLMAHKLTDGVRLCEHHLIYDVGATPPLPET